MGVGRSEEGGGRTREKKKGEGETRKKREKDRRVSKRRILREEGEMSMKCVQVRIV